jgi:glycosyltransferase involved in cell wall biosynthesis
MNPAPLVSLVMPVFNEVHTLAEIIRRVVAVDFPKELVLVDDCSTDGSREFLEEVAKLGLAAVPGAEPKNENRFTVLLQEKNQGKGAALRRGFRAAKGDIVVVQDADLEYDPADVPALVEPIVRGVADVVYGSRLSGGRPQRAYLFWHMVGNRFLSLLTGVLFNTTLSDMETGYKAFRSEILQSLDLREDDFGIEPEITGKVCRRKLRVYELPIAYYGRTYAEGKKITWRDGFKAIRVLLRVRLLG